MTWTIGWTVLRYPYKHGEHGSYVPTLAANRVSVMGPILWSISQRASAKVRPSG